MEQMQRFMSGFCLHLSGSATRHTPCCICYNGICQAFVYTYLAQQPDIRHVASATTGTRIVFKLRFRFFLGQCSYTTYVITLYFINISLLIQYKAYGPINKPHYWSRLFDVLLSQYTMLA